MPNLYKATGISLFLMLAACSSKGEREFMSGCTQGGSKSECSCVYDTLEKHYSPERMEKMSAGEMGIAPDFLDRMAQAAYQCRQ